MSNKMGKMGPVLLLYIFLSVAFARRLPTATIIPGFGSFRGNKEEENRKQHKPPPPGGAINPPHDPRKPPPPPPPPKSQAQVAAAAGEKTSENDAQDGGGKSQTQQHQQQNPSGDNGGGGGGEQFDPPDYPPHPQFWAPGPFDPYGGLPPPPPGWMGPPPDWNHQPGDWGQQQQQQQQHPHLDIEEFMVRESGLLSEIQNLTTTLASHQQREDLHMRQLDVLTERVMDVEANAASERNQLVESRANCTELGRTVAVLQDEILEWTQRCNNVTIHQEQQEEALEEVKKTLKERNREVEDLATHIENGRLEVERERYLVARKQKQKKRGFFAWLFGVTSKEEEEDDRLQDAQEFARSTLLRALQTERDSVHELETVLATLQQNNSAISEMVESRDMLIDELNNRVEVFEEDKLVLKAALQQLQREMREEAPKTQKLIDDLKDAREEIQRLNTEIDEIIAEHQSKVSLMQGIISQKQDDITATESNMTVIGSYVDRLEERLASFAFARRDIDLREKKCNEIEERAETLEKQCEEMRKRVEDYESEHEDLKSLLADLVNERAELQGEKNALTKEKSGLLADGTNLRNTISSLELDVDSLGKVVSEWRSQVTSLETTLEAQTNVLREKGDKEAELQRLLEERTSELYQLLEEKARQDVQLADEANSRARQDALRAEESQRAAEEAQRVEEAQRAAEAQHEAEEAQKAEEVQRAQDAKTAEDAERVQEAQREAEAIAEAEAARQQEADQPYYEAMSDFPDDEDSGESMSLQAESVEVETKPSIPPPPPPPPADAYSGVAATNEAYGNNDDGDDTLPFEPLEEPETVDSRDEPDMPYYQQQFSIGQSGLPSGGAQLGNNSFQVYQSHDQDDESEDEDAIMDDSESEDDAADESEDESESEDETVDNAESEDEATAVDESGTTSDEPEPVDATDSVSQESSDDSPINLDEPQLPGDETKQETPAVTKPEIKESTAVSLPPRPVLPPGMMPPQRKPPQPRRVPFRKVRKAFSRATGVHGLFTKPSPHHPSRQQKQS